MKSNFYKNTYYYHHEKHNKVRNLKPFSIFSVLNFSNHTRPKRQLRKSNRIGFNLPVQRVAYTTLIANRSKQHVRGALNGRSSLRIPKCTFGIGQRGRSTSPCHPILSSRLSQPPRAQKPQSISLISAQTRAALPSLSGSAAPPPAANAWGPWDTIQYIYVCEENISADSNFAVIFDV